MNRIYRFTADADDDFIAIWLDTEERWGEQQADIYLDELHEGCQRIADDIAATRPVEGLEAIRCYRCRHHFLFYTVSAHEIVIIAALHERMDMVKRLIERLSI
ncbi:MAG: type II toxin-antitoxin system RelE/ParE family toxin [Rhodobiaceae bacterium]|jgi:toxin ParE1/3/4|nr:type II toxin-antitoxin system RelE/ParE family toxin [Rhodobiaceae bacterium]